MYLFISGIYFWCTETPLCFKPFYKTKGTKANLLKLGFSMKNIYFINYSGGYCWHRRLYFHILAGAWCLTCFVLTTAYSSVLISFVTMPNYQPLIRSVYELQTKPKIGVTVEKGFEPDLIFMAIANNLTAYSLDEYFHICFIISWKGAVEAICKLIGDKLRNGHHSMRCNTSDECVARVKRSSTSIFIQVRVKYTHVDTNKVE